MNSEFEKKMMEQPLRQAPAEWRAELLREARIAAVQQAPAVTGWRSRLWPAPRAWAALAACWLVLLTANALNRPMPSALALRPDGVTLMTALAEKRRTLQEMDIIVVVHQARPVMPRLRPGASSWLREEKGALPC